MDESQCKNCGSVIKSNCMEQRESKNGKNYNSREDTIDIFSNVDFEKLCHGITFFLNRIKILCKKKLLFLSHQVQ